MCLPYVSSNIFRLDDHESWSFEGYWNLMLYQPSYEEMWEFPDDTRLELCEFWSRSLPCKKPVVMKQRLAARKPENSSNLRFFPAGEILLQLVKA